MLGAETGVDGDVGCLKGKLGSQLAVEDGAIFRTGHCDGDRAATYRMHGMLGVLLVMGVHVDNCHAWDGHGVVLRTCPMHRKHQSNDGEQDWQQPPTKSHGRSVSMFCVRLFQPNIVNLRLNRPAVRPVRCLITQA